MSPIIGVDSPPLIPLAVTRPYLDEGTVFGAGIRGIQAKSITDTENIGVIGSIGVFMPRDVP
jgi:hypothetical protein